MDLSLVPYQRRQQQQRDINNKIKYKECMRNHAASIGGHANDGCGEFMPSADSASSGETDSASSMDSLICAACGCHRNFHRRESPGGKDSPPFNHHHHLIHQPPPPMLLYKAYHHGGGGGVMTGADHSRCDFDRRSETPEREEMNLNVGPWSGSGSGSGKAKRHRTKFTQEQKERMLEFAERTGWRMNRQDDVALNRFCTEVGITRNVLKVWMHNNKSNYRRTGEPTSQPSVVAPPPPPAQPVGV